MSQLSLFKNNEFQSFKKDLTSRVIPSDEDLEKYNFLLKKEDLTKACIEYNNERFGYFNSGIPQYVLTSLKQFYNKNQDELSVLDLVIFYKSIHENLSDAILEKGDTNILFRKWRKANNLNFFGSRQYEFIKKYIKDFVFA